MADTLLFDLNFKRKYKNYGDMCQSLAYRAAYQIQTRQWNKDKTLPKEPPGYALVDFVASDERYIFFEYCNQEYLIRLWTIRVNEFDQIEGYCSVFKVAVASD